MRSTINCTEHPLHPYHKNTPAIRQECLFEREMERSWKKKVRMWHSAFWKQKFKMGKGRFLVQTAKISKTYKNAED